MLSNCPGLAAPPGPGSSSHYLAGDERTHRVDPAAG
jgi:hypothetical protein